MELDRTLARAIGVDTEDYSHIKPGRVTRRNFVNAQRWLLGGLGVIALLSVAAGRAQADGGGSFNADRIAKSYTQCGGSGHPDNHTVYVYRLKDPDGWHTFDAGWIPGNCGNIWYRSDDEIQTLDQIKFQDSSGSPHSIGDGQHTWIFKRRFPQCGGEFGVGARFKDNHTILIDEFVHPFLSPGYSARNVGPQPGQCGNP